MLHENTLIVWKLDRVGMQEAGRRELKIQGRYTGQDRVREFPVWRRKHGKEIVQRDIVDARPCCVCPVEAAGGGR